MCYKFPLFRIQIFLINEFVPQEIMESMKEIIHYKKWGKFNCFGIYAWLILGITSCYHKVQEEKNSVNKEIVQQQEKIRSFFPFPEIPAMLTQPEERKAYLIAHYWDNFNFADTALVNNRNITEQGIVDFLAILADGTLAERQQVECIDNFCGGLEQQAYAQKIFLQMMEDYLYNPNSPYYNEGLYVLFLKRMLESKYVDDLKKSSLLFTLQLINQNSPGQRAMNFIYYLPDGSRHTLYQTRVNKNRLLLVFYDPECPSCHDVMMEMLHDKLLQQEVDAGNLTVLAIYTEGNLDVWKTTISELPKEWIVGTDREEIKQRCLYDLKAMPSLYLLDGDKKVILKDVSHRKICSEILY